jgi:hypothetical protein
LPRQLEAHANARVVQGKLVGSVQRHQAQVRGAECNPVAADPIGPKIPELAEAARGRLRGLGMWNDQMADVVANLSAEAKEHLERGYIVSMRCRTDPYQLYVATSFEENRHVVVGLATSLPRFLGGEAPNHEVIKSRLSGKALGVSDSSIGVTEGQVDTWIPVPMEEF